MKDTPQNTKVVFNQTYEYKLPSFEDPEGMPVYVSIACNPYCYDFVTVKSQEKLVFSPFLWSHVKNFDM